MEFAVIIENKPRRGAALALLAVAGMVVAWVVFSQSTRASKATLDDLWRVVSDSGEMIGARRAAAIKILRVERARSALLLELGEVGDSELALALDAVSRARGR